MNRYGSLNFLLCCRCLWCIFRGLFFRCLSLSRLVLRHIDRSDITLLLDEQANQLAHSDALGLAWDEYLCQVPILLGLEADGGLVGLDLADEISDFHLVTLFFVPLQDVAL
jgi:hypothetical protein